MVDVGEDAPDFSAAVIDGSESFGTFTLSEQRHRAPIVLAFFPAAFSGTCTTELVTFRGEQSRLESVGAHLYGVSTDLPFALDEFHSQHDLGFSLLSDPDHDIIRAYDVVDSWADLHIDEVARRSVFVIDEDGTVTYRWVTEDPGVEPDYEEVLAAAEDAA